MIIQPSFYPSGYDTTASALAYLGYYLARKPEVQERLQQEIDAAFAANEGKMPGYNVIQVRFKVAFRCIQGGPSARRKAYIEIELKFPLEAWVTG